MLMFASCYWYIIHFPRNDDPIDDGQDTYTDQHNDFIFSNNLFEHMTLIQ